MKKIKYSTKTADRKTKTARILLDVFTIVLLIWCSLVLVFTIQTKNSGGVPTFFGNSYWKLTNNQELFNSDTVVVTCNNKGLINFNSNDIVGYKTFNQNNGNVDIKFAKFSNATTSNTTLKINGKKTTFNNDLIIGKVTKQHNNANTYDIFTNKNAFIYLCVLPLAILLIVGIFAYFILYPKKIAIPFFEEMFESVSADTKDEKENKVENKTLNLEIAEKDDTIVPYMNAENAEISEVSKFKINNFYTSAKSKDGELYALVKKFDDSISSLEDYGASDMDIIRINMVGNEKFDELLTKHHKEKAMTMQEIIEFTSGLDNIYCIKKRGMINWTFKYKSKTLLIIRGNEKGFKVSLKCYPDAAEKINLVFKALEDSNFPSGPYWFMFNDLKNLTAPVVKWLIKESYRISILQQRKADLLKDHKTLEDLGIDSKLIKSQIDSGVKSIIEEKYAIIPHKIDKEENQLTTLLDKEIENVDTSVYVKEFYHLVNGRDDFAISLLFKKNASEQLSSTLAMEIENFSTTAIKKEPEVNNDVKKSDYNKTVVKKKTTKRR